eukprot:5796479-Pleurochrysis_carterae.AAC.2
MRTSDPVFEDLTMHSKLSYDVLQSRLLHAIPAAAWGLSRLTSARTLRAPAYMSLSHIKMHLNNRDSQKQGQVLCLPQTSKARPRAIAARHYLAFEAARVELVELYVSRCVRFSHAPRYGFL